MNCPTENTKKTAVKTAENVTTTRKTGGVTDVRQKKSLQNVHSPYLVRRDGHMLETLVECHECRSLVFPHGAPDFHTQRILIPAIHYNYRTNLILICIIELLHALRLMTEDEYSATYALLSDYVTET
jgi:hypothetical protein